MRIPLELLPSLKRMLESSAPNFDLDDKLKSVD